MGHTKVGEEKVRPLGQGRKLIGWAPITGNNDRSPLGIKSVRENIVYITVAGTFIDVNIHTIDHKSITRCKNIHLDTSSQARNALCNSKFHIIFVIVDHFPNYALNWRWAPHL